MIDRAVLRHRVRTAARHISAFGGSLEKECARMNDGLTAIAIALTVVVVLIAAIRLPVLLGPDSQETTQLQDLD